MQQLKSTISNYMTDLFFEASYYNKIKNPRNLTKHFMPMYLT